MNKTNKHYDETQINAWVNTKPVNLAVNLF